MADMFEEIFKKKESPQYGARVKLLRIKSVKSLTDVNLAKEIGIGVSTLRTFLTHEIDVKRYIYIRMLDYIEYCGWELSGGTNGH